MKWVTRSNAHVDRIACPWLIRKFVDSQAEFLFVPASMVKEVAKSEGAIPFDAPGIELTHYEEDGHERVSFDAIIKKYGLKDPALLKVAEIVRGADAKIAEAPQESAGLKAVAEGFQAIAKDDHDNISRQFPTYDALYAFCKLAVQKKA
ncbi:MAG: chromate resistance protein [Nitrososphaerota archaeon]|nr:chromate resistance protein [Nitrososphaerota archaeon]MDG7010780.1 chromate resistance protein [Nitrososphaerota archaeon]